MVKMKGAIFFTVLTALWQINAEDPLIVQTNLGKVKGKYTSFQEIKVREFLGIPYAKPPVGELRFRPPLPAEPWNGVYEGTEVPNMCQQITVELPKEIGISFPSERRESEDCLYLNVRVPDQQSDTKKPVLVLIHGGGFNIGSGEDPIHSTLSLTAIGNVITVSMNYRLGILGFFDADVPEAPGNQGLLDQNLAFQWVKQNIEYFGGDSNQITIYGNSAGSMSVSAHLLSPLSKGLFQRAIMSGGSILSQAILQNAQKNIVRGNKAASILGCSVDGGDLVSKTKEVLQCLRSKDVKELIQAQTEVSPTWVDSFLPTYGSSFLPTNPLSSDDFFTVDAELIVGTSRNEGASFLYPKNISMAFTPPDVNTENEARRFSLDVLAEIGLDVVDGDLDVYFEGLQIASREDLIIKIVDVVGDVLFLCPSVRLAEQHASNGNRVYYYNFGRNSKKSKYPAWMGVTHGTDFMFMHGVTFRLEKMYTDEDRELSRKLHKGTAHFAATGRIPELETVQWKLFNRAKQLYLAVNQDNVTLNSRPRGVFCENWKKKI